MDRTIIRACIGIAGVLAATVQQTVSEANLGHGVLGDFFYCLGGAVAKYISKYGKDTEQPSAADSFMEGFSSYRRFLSEANTVNKMPPKLSWLVDNGNSVH